MRKSIVLAGLLALIPTVSQAKTLEELLVEKGIMTKSEAAETSKGDPASTYYDGGTRFEFASNGFTAQLNTLIQTRYEYVDNDEEIGARNTSGVTVERARIIASGKVLHNEFSYYIQPDFTRTPTLLDGYITWHACDWMDVRMGQYKTGISRQFNNSDSKMQFPDRSVASEYFDLGRDGGLTVSGKLLDGDLWVAGSMFNGQSDGEGINEDPVDTNHTAIAQVRWNALGKMDSYVEGDVGWTEDPAVSIGAAYAFADANNDLGAGAEDIESNTVSVDLNFKYSGWGAHAEIFSNTLESDETDTVDTDTVGFYAQVGYFLDPKTTEVAVQYSLVDCDSGEGLGACQTGAPLDLINGVQASLNYHWWDHKVKAQLAYSYTNFSPEDDDLIDDFNVNKIIFQLQGAL